MGEGKRILLFSSISLMVLLIGCRSQHSADEHYILVASNLQVSYWQTAGAGFMQEAQQMRVRAEFVGPKGYDPKAQQDEFRKAVQQKPTGILVSPADPSLMQNDIDQAIAAGIPVITIDSDAPSSKRLFFIGTNNYQAGLMGGQRLVKELQGKGNFVVFTMPEQVNLKERLRGYLDALEDHPQIKIVQVIDIKGDPRVAFDSATEIVGKKEKVDAFVCLEAQAGKEVATVLKNSGVKDKIVLAMDTDPDTLDAIQQGFIVATISQKPFTMTNFGLRMLDDLHHYKLNSLSTDWSQDSFAPIPSFVDTGSSLIDKKNVVAFQEFNKSMTKSTAQLQ
jgi:ribose transport system substrate-binding protein